MQMPCPKKREKFTRFRWDAEARSTVLLANQQAKKQLEAATGRLISKLIP
jgi:hypothetical protein